MENKSALGLVVLGAVALLIGVILVEIIADQTADRTVKLSVMNESVTSTINVYTNVSVNVTAVKTLAKAYTDGVWQTDVGGPCTVDVLSVYTSNSTLLVSGTDYRLDSRIGNFTLLNTLANNNTVVLGNYTRWNYAYCDKEYLNTGWARTIANMVPGFYALGIFVIAAFLIFWILRKEGIEFNI